MGGYLVVEEWQTDLSGNNGRWVATDYIRDYGPQDAGTGGYASSAGPQAYGSTAEGFAQSLAVERERIQADIDATKQRLTEIQLQEDAAGGRLDRQLASEKEQLQLTLGVRREELQENRRQFDAQLQLNSTLGLGNLDLSKGRLDLDTLLGKGQLDLAGRQQDLDELLGMGQLDLSGRAQDLAELQTSQRYDIDLKSLDLQGQSLAIQSRKAELDSQVAQGQLDVQRAQMQLEKEIATGRLQLDRETLKQNADQFNKNFSLQQELGRAQARVDERNASVNEGRLRLDTELGRASEDRQRKALYVEQFGRDPVRQALLALGMGGGTTPQEAQFRDMGLRTGGGQLRDIQAGMTSPQAVPVGENGMEIAVPREGGVEILPVAKGMAEGGFIATPPEDSPLNARMAARRGAKYQPNAGASYTTRGALGETLSFDQPSARAYIEQQKAKGIDTTNMLKPLVGPGATPGGATNTPDFTTPAFPPSTVASAVPPDYQAAPDQQSSLVARALERALGLREGTINIDQSTGVNGLPSAEQSAYSYMTSGFPVQDLIESGYGVGGVSGGVNADEYRRRVLDVTPRGSLSF